MSGRALLVFALTVGLQGSNQIEKERLVRNRCLPHIDSICGWCLSPQLYFYILGVAVVKWLFLMQMKHRQSNQSPLVRRSTCSIARNVQHVEVLMCFDQRIDHLQ